MTVDILPIEGKYRGIERSVNVHHLGAKKAFDRLLNMYFDYITSTVIDVDECDVTFDKIYPFYIALKEVGTQCEMVVFDAQPLTDFYGRDIELLGIDIVNQFFETRLIQPSISIPERLLNGHGLCNNIDDCSELMELLSKHPTPEHEWKPCYVYRIIC